MQQYICWSCVVIYKPSSEAPVYFVTDVPRRNARLFLAVASNRFSEGESYAAAFMIRRCAFAKFRHQLVR